MTLDEKIYKQQRLFAKLRSIDPSFLAGYVQNNLYDTNNFDIYEIDRYIEAMDDNFLNVIGKLLEYHKEVKEILEDALEYHKTK